MIVQHELNCTYYLTQTASYSYFYSYSYSYSMQKSALNTAHIAWPIISLQ